MTEDLIALIIITTFAVKVWVTIQIVNFMASLVSVGIEYARYLRTQKSLQDMRPLLDRMLTNIEKKEKGSHDGNP